jgi:hypothetical protein
MTSTLRGSRRSRHALTFSALLLSSGALLYSSRAGAQLIAVKTLPIADGEQFSFFPSANRGMGGVSIAIRDSLHDLFVNPAKAGFGRSYFFGSPSFFSVSSKSGSGSTFPAGVVARSGSSFAALAVAIQSITDGRRADVFTSGGGFRLANDVAVNEGGTAQSHSNNYAFVMLGRTFASKLSVAASALVSTLGAIDGVNLLYTSSRSVKQSGGTADFRIGMQKEWHGGQSFEALVLRRRASMDNDITYMDLFWDPIQRLTIERPRQESDGEKTNTTGLHLGYQRRLADSAWRVGAIVTANRLDHLNTPEYEIASLPSDRGHSSALNLGVGVARTQGGATLAIDAIYEPIWSRLWAVADSSTTNAALQTGSKAIDNQVRFSNALLRVGLSQDVELESQSSLVRFQLGMQARSVYYTVDQSDLLSGATRTGGDEWLEFTRSWGIVWRSPAIEIRYAGRLTSGAARPGVSTQNQVPVGPLVDRISAPQFAVPTTLNNVRVTMHQLAVSLPVR